MNHWQRHPHAFSSTSRSHKGLETAIRYLRWTSALSSREQDHCNRRGLMHGCGLGGPSGARIPHAANSHRFYTRVLFLMLPREPWLMHVLSILHVRSGNHSCPTETCSGS